MADRARTRQPRHRVEPVAAHDQPIVVGVGHPLGPTGRAGGVTDDVPVVCRNGNAGVGIVVPGQPFFVAGVANHEVVEIGRLALESRHRVGVGVIGQHHLALGVLDHVLVGRPRVAWIERDPDRPGHGAADQEVGSTQVVVFETGDAIARLHTEGSQGVRQPDTPSPSLGESQRAIFTDDRDPVTVIRDRLAHECPHIHGIAPYEQDHALLWHASVGSRTRALDLLEATAASACLRGNTCWYTPV